MNANEIPVQSFGELARQVRPGVDSVLASCLDEHVTALGRAGTEAEAAARALQDLTMRGGKRLRAVLLAAGYVACGGEGGPAAVVRAGAAVELLQTYLLVHDDWMDEDNVRRGGPSVHAALRVHFGNAKVGDSAAILAGDYACALAQDLLLSLPLPAGHVLEAARLFARIQEDVVTGQILDVCAGHAPLSRLLADRVEAIYDLKTASYTVCGPLGLGALLAGASAGVRASLEGFGRPLGIAFQLRDDLLGLYGDTDATGKPSGGDLRRGKRTALVAELAHDAEGQARLEKVLGRADARDESVRDLAEYMDASGARARVETRVTELLSEARSALFESELGASGKELLAGAIPVLGERNH